MTKADTNRSLPASNQVSASRARKREFRELRLACQRPPSRAKVRLFERQRPRDFGLSRGNVGSFPEGQL
jgi:hypothetical protein